MSFTEHTPSSERATVIEGLVANSKVDIVSVLGRPARRLKIVSAAVGDSISFKLNSLKRIQPRNPKNDPQDLQTTVKVWSGAPIFSTFVVTGEEEYLSEEGLSVSSFHCTALTGSAFKLVVW